MVTAFVAIKPFDPSQADDAPERLQHIEEIVSCYSVAGEANICSRCRRPRWPTWNPRWVASEQRLKCPANTTTVLSIPFEDRPRNLINHSSRTGS